MFTGIIYALKLTILALQLKKKWNWYTGVVEVITWSKTSIYANVSFMKYFMLSTLISKALFSFQFIKDLHSWPLTSAHGLTWTEASWDFLQALTANHLNWFSALFSMSVSVDDKNSSRYIIAVSKITKTHVHEVWLI